MTGASRCDCKNYVMNWSPDIYLKAWQFASRAHRGQTYGGPEPGLHIEYINHIGSVAMEIVHSIGSDPNYDTVLAIQCALLHDTLEDTDTTYEELAELFGEDTARGVSALTKNKAWPSKREQMQDSLARIRKEPAEVWMVKMADRISNLAAPPYYWDRYKVAAYRQEALLIHQTLREGHEGLAQRLLQKIEDYQRYIAL